MPDRPSAGEALLAPDGSEDASLAAQAAADLAEKSDAGLHLVHTWTGVLSTAYHALTTENYSHLYEEEVGTLLEAEVRGIREGEGTVAEAHLREVCAVDEVVALADGVTAEACPSHTIPPRDRGAQKKNRTKRTFASGKELDEMIMLPNRILLATDGSKDAASAARVAADLAERADAKLHVVHAWQADLPKAYAVTVPNTAVSWCERQAGELLDRRVERIEWAGGAVAEGHLLRGEPVEKITELAEDLDVDLVVVGSRDLGTVRRLTTGSVSEGVVRDASRPVLVVRGAEAIWPPARVVVGEDFSEDSEAAAKLAASIGRLYAARTFLVHAYPLLELGSKVPISGVFWVNGEVRTARRTLELLAREIEEEVGERPEARVAIGDAASCILEAATEGAEPTLVVVGSRGLGVLERFRVGSVSTRVMREAEGPVLVYRRP